MEVGFSGQSDIKCFESGSRLSQQNGRLTPRNGCPLDLSSELLHPCPLKIVDGIRFGLRQQASYSVERAGVQIRGGGSQGSVGPSFWFGGQRHRTLKNCCCRRQAGARLGSDRCLFKHGRHNLVGFADRCGLVPQPSFRINSGIGSLGERPMGRSS
jgi:hypothetical protein